MIFSGEVAILPSIGLQTEEGASLLQAGFLTSVGVSAEDRKLLLGSRTGLMYPKGVQLVGQGAAVGEVYFISTGLLKSVYLDQSGREMIVGLCVPGSMIGVAPVVVQCPSPVSVFTLTRCELSRIAAREFLDLVKTDAKFSWYLQQEQSREIYRQVACTTQLGCHSARQRLERLLWQMTCDPAVVQCQRGIGLHLPLKHWEIAELISVTPEHLSRLMKKMQQEGLISRKGGLLIVLDRQKLSHPTEFSCIADEMNY
jgi:CRP-like cAMP-binding protein